jgi:Flp pilus assembly protein CpaB
MPAAANPAANAQAATNPNPTPTPVPEPPLVVTLQVTPAQANLLVMADLNSNLRLALRPPQEPARSQPVEALVFPVPEVAKAPGGPGGKPTSTHPGVTVINGDTIEGP